MLPTGVVWEWRGTSSFCSLTLTFLVSCPSVFASAVFCSSGIARPGLSQAEGNLGRSELWSSSDQRRVAIFISNTMQDDWLPTYVELGAAEQRTTGLKHLLRMALCMLSMARVFDGVRSGVEAVLARCMRHGVWEPQLISDPTAIEPKLSLMRQVMLLAVARRRVAHGAAHAHVHTRPHHAHPPSRRSCTVQGWRAVL